MLNVINARDDRDKNDIASEKLFMSHASLMVNNNAKYMTKFLIDCFGLDAKTIHLTFSKKLNNIPLCSTTSSDDHKDSNTFSQSLRIWHYSDIYHSLLYTHIYAKSMTNHSILLPTQ